MHCFQILFEQTWKRHLIKFSGKWISGQKKLEEQKCRVPGLSPFFQV
jgi:hypothetical protein